MSSQTFNLGAVTAYAEAVAGGYTGTREEFRQSLANLARMAQEFQCDPCVYAGTNLAEKFAEEITAYSDVWAWIQARIQAGNYIGLYVGDYIPFTTTSGISFTAQIAGIDTYTEYGDNGRVVGHHIDFICKELWPTSHVFNKVNFNNGISEDAPYPWLVSDLYHYCNSLSGTVPNDAKVGGGDGEAVDYTADGIYYYLPAALQNVIIPKRMLFGKRYSASSLLTADKYQGWADAGKLWIPTEWEVFGGAIWGNVGAGAGGSGVQYPLFAHSMRRVRYQKGGRGTWWVLSTYAGNSTYFTAVSALGYASCAAASTATMTVPVCFRVS